MTDKSIAGLPVGCPETLCWNLFGIHVRADSCCTIPLGCTPVEFHPQGTRDRMNQQLTKAELDELVGYLEDAVLRAKGKTAYVYEAGLKEMLKRVFFLKSLTPGAPDANAMEPENDPTWEFQDEAGPEDMEDA